MALSLNSFGSFLSKFAANQEVLTTVATSGLLDRNHYSSSGHSGGGYQHHHYSSGKKKKRSIAMSALTLLSFLFFLNILQNCIQEHINQMNPTMIVMQMQTVAAVRKADRKGDDGGELFENSTSTFEEKGFDSEDIPEDFTNNKSSEKTEEVITDIKGSRKENNKRNKVTNRKEATNVKVKPTKASLYVATGEYEYSQIPIKLKTVERYNYKKLDD
ncbi:hypothetical protein HHI36_010164 [Cryptolaemus montrouzieri]|uniref:Transmembrane protein n=1 Tax=Cryptolaemus montrouzieri TaxID=559131 RepID=A0ABD2MI50_9CUCU